MRLCRFQPLSSRPQAARFRLRSMFGLKSGRISKKQRPDRGVQWKSGHYSIIGQNGSLTVQSGCSTKSCFHSIVHTLTWPRARPTNGSDVGFALHTNHHLTLFVRAFQANIVDACDDEQPLILEQCLKHRDKVSCTGTETFEYAAHQVSFQPHTVEATHIPGP